MSISTRMTLLIAVVAAAVMAGAGVAYQQVRNMEFDGRVVNHAGIVRGATQRLVKLELAGRPNDGLIAKLDRLVNGLIEGDAELALPPARDPDFLAKMSAVRKSWGELKGLLLKGRTDPEARAGILDASEAYFKLTNDAVFAAEAFGKRKVLRFLAGVGVVTLMILGATLLVWRTLQTRVARPLHYLAGEIAKVARKDVTVRLEVKGNDEIGALAASANDMIGTMRDLIVEAKNASVELASISEELSATTAQIASANQQVSAQTRAVATGAQEMNTTVQDVAQNTAAANEASESARTTATEGGRVVEQAVDATRAIAQVVEQAATTVRALGERTQSIGTVIQVIEDIADQTNLLALNAAIEAARAGEHGRGFAVVADEVRKLAEKTVKATQEIGQTIASIQGESRRVVEAIDQGMETVAQGRELGERAGNAIHEIEGQVSSAAEQIQQIATATEELSATIRQMADNMEEIAVGTDQNTRAASEIAVTADALSKKAERLRDMTAEFQT